MTLTRHEIARDEKIGRSLERIAAALEDAEPLDAVQKIGDQIEELVAAVSRIEDELVEVRKALPGIA